MKEFITMSRKEKAQCGVFEQLKRKEITQAAAAQMLNLSERQIRTKFKRFKNEGMDGLIHKNRGKESPRKFNPEKKALAIDLLKSDIWFEFGPTFASEKLAELHNINISRETLRQILRAEKIPYETRRGGKGRRKRRERKRMEGIMVQLDGSPHKWFGPDGQAFTLLVFIDDATSKVLWIEFVKSESVESVMKATRNYVEKFGRPVSFYTDFGSVFRVNTNNPDHEKLTQFERAVGELGIEIIHAHSPQAKGRVERSNKTHQNRLIKELRLLGIVDPEEANKFLPQYIEKHNKKFAVLAAEEGDAHRSIAGYDLDAIFCIQETRKVQNDYTIRYKNRILQLADQRNVRFRPKDEILVKAKFDGALKLSIRGFNIEYKELVERPAKAVAEKIYNNSKPRPMSEASRRWNGPLSTPKNSFNQSISKGSC